MHEKGLVQDLVRHAEAVCLNRSKKATRMTVVVGALSGVDPAYVDAYFNILVSDDSPLASADLDVSLSEVADDLSSLGVLLKSISFEMV